MKRCVIINSDSKAANIDLSLSEFDFLKGRKISDFYFPRPFINNIISLKKTSQLFNILKSEHHNAISVQLIRMKYHLKHFPNIAMITLRAKSWCAKDLSDFIAQKMKRSNTEKKIGYYTTKQHEDYVATKINQLASFICKQHIICGAAIIFDFERDFTLNEFQKLHRNSYRFNEDSAILSLVCTFYARNYEVTYQNMFHYEPIKKPDSIIEFADAVAKQNENVPNVNIENLLKCERVAIDFIKSHPTFIDNSLQQEIKRYFSEKNEVSTKEYQEPLTPEKRQQLVDEFVAISEKDYMIALEDLYVILKPKIEEIYVKNNKSFYISFISNAIGENEMLPIRFTKGSKRNKDPYTWDTPPKPSIDRKTRADITTIMKKQCQNAGEEYIDPFT